MSESDINPRLLLVSTRDDDRALCESIAATAQMDLQQVQSWAEAVPFLEDPAIAGLFMDTPDEVMFKAFEAAFRTARARGKALDPNLLHFLTSQEVTSVAHLVTSDLFCNYILRNPADPSEAGRVYGRIVRASVPDQGSMIHQVLDPGAEIRSVCPVISTQKAELIDMVAQFLTERGFPPRIATRMASAADELLMNAIFDAPVDSSGEFIYKTTPRSTVVPLEGKHRVDLSIGFDGRYAAISVIDHFGSLQKTLVTEKLARTYKNRAYQVNNAAAGAGLGIFTIFHSGVSLVFRTQPKVRTEALITFKRTDTTREFKEQFQFLSLVSKSRR